MVTIVDKEDTMYDEDLIDLMETIDDVLDQEGIEEVSYRLRDRCCCVGSGWYSRVFDVGETVVAKITSDDYGVTCFLDFIEDYRTEDWAVHLPRIHVSYTDGDDCWILVLEKLEKLSYVEKAVWGVMHERLEEFFCEQYNSDYPEINAKGLINNIWTAFQQAPEDFSEDLEHLMSNGVISKKSAHVAQPYDYEVYSLGKADKDTISAAIIELLENNSGVLDAAFELWVANDSNYGTSFDVHSDNVMWRVEDGKRTLVITDPYAG